MENDFKFRNFRNGNYKRSGGQHCHSKCISTGTSEFAMPMLTFRIYLSRGGVSGAGVGCGGGDGGKGCGGGGGW